jgi:hypothetical protein
MAKLLKAAGCNRVVIIGQHYKNWTAGGDTAVSEETYYGICRVAQQAAVADCLANNPPIDALYINTYSYQRSLIVAAVRFTQGDNKFHAVADNQHLAIDGHTTIQEAVMAGIVANKPEWLTSLAT